MKSKKMKHNNDHPTSQDVKATKRKQEDVENGALKPKIPKKHVQNGNPSKSKKTKSKPTFNTAHVFTEGLANTQAVNAEGSKKKKVKKHLGGGEDPSMSTSSSAIATVVDSVKKKKKNRLDHESANFSSNDKSLNNTNVKKKKKNRQNEQTTNGSGAVDTSVVNSDVKKKKKKKKNRVNQKNLNALAESATTVLNSDVEKKIKDKQTLEKSLSDNAGKFPSNPLPKTVKKKRKKNKKKALSGGQGSSSEIHNEAEINGVVKPKILRKKKKSKLGNTEGNNDSQGTDTAQIILQNKHISRLINFKTKQEGLLSNASETNERKRIESLIRKIEHKIQKLKLGVGKQSSKTKTTEVVNQCVFKGLPQDPPPAKKKYKRVELKEFLENQMKASRFRWLNENLYSSSSEEAQTFFKEDPGSFKAYHEGYSEQVAKWPVNPVDVIIKELKSMPRGSVVADLGCGEAKLAAGLPHLKVHSLDFIALKPEVTACDMAHCPLLRSSVDVAVFCLSLMGTNISDFLLEANRILKSGGTMEIAEVESRFQSIEDFVEKVQKYGFQLKKKSPTDMFFFLTFKKTHDVSKSGKLPDIELKACIYKKR